MKGKKYVIYVRVSTKKQDLSPDAQRDTCRKVIKSIGGVEIGAFEDRKTGGDRNRVGVRAAIEMCKSENATLIMAKLDRLARDAEFSYKVKNSGIDLYFCDMPNINTLTFGVMVSMAEHEREIGSSRTKSALAEIKKHIEKDGFYLTKAGNTITSLGCPEESRNTEPARLAAIEARRGMIAKDKEKKKVYLVAKSIYGRYKEDGTRNTMNDVADELNRFGYKTPKGGTWSKGQVSRILSDWSEYFD